ncbi:MAG: DUF1559 domain-containing protein [Planctomycetes bacterium]|nr:DUF1559 domain-containing protein [Planctomycetota bacterium]MCH9725199.1 DUF1559 domain-containing protein [Planctomycetota bacterium]MCH9776609.1 DUF1559 domain-containing protein [Planctomycetota bacterium]MCH9789444.1 DUF1559 domain-containing protein [Planctomycetota bacterium]
MSVCPEEKEDLKKRFSIRENEMNQQRTKQNCQKRNGFSLLELLVVIIVIGILVALTLPAIESGKTTSRKLSCLNNMRNVGLAVVNFSSGANSELPLLVDPNKTIDPDGTNANAHRDNLSWCTTILPFMDSVGFRQRWDATARAASVVGADPSALIALNQTRFPVLSCPDDQFNTDPGALSYVVNVGYVTANYNTLSDTSHAADSADGGFDSNSTINTDIPVKFASGVFWRPHESRMSLDFITEGDGMTQTLMLSENLQAGAWADQDTGSLGFGVDMQGILKDASLKLPSGFNLRTARTDSSISSNLTAEKGQAWRPSSNHPSGVVNVIFCDGSGKSLTPQMDPGIYARLLTPAGQRYDQAPVDGTSF